MMLSLSKKAGDRWLPAQMPDRPFQATGGLSEYRAFFRMNCVGGPAARFQTVHDACVEYCVDRGDVLQAAHPAAGGGHFRRKGRDNSACAN